jgi:hypothetical protein
MACLVQDWAHISGQWRTHRETHKLHNSWNYYTIKEFVHQDRHRNIHDIAAEVEIGYGTCQRVLTKELGMHCVAASPWQFPVSHFHPHPAVSGDIQNGCHPPPTVLPWYDFFLFPKTKLKLKGRQFDTTEEIQAESQSVFDTLTEQDFQEAFLKWRRWWDQSLHVGGNYFKADGSWLAVWWVLWFFTVAFRNILDTTTYVWTQQDASYNHKPFLLCIVVHLLTTCTSPKRCLLVQLTILVTGIKWEVTCIFRSVLFSSTQRFKCILQVLFPLSNKIQTFCAAEICKIVQATEWKCRWRKHPQ